MSKAVTVCRTDGKGLWSKRAASVAITDLQLIVIHWPDRSYYGELKVFFDPAKWDRTKHGLIYTDKLWMEELRAFFQTRGFSKVAVDDVDYSEQGMQGRDYVSLDAGEDFIKEADPLYRFAVSAAAKSCIIKIENIYYEDDE